MSTVHIGIAGWSYDDWKGKVYAAGCRDPLAFCARFVRLLEVNSTFYRTPPPTMVASWVERTAAAGTLFTAKLPGLFTHDRRLDAAAVGDFATAMRPLAASGRLRALLAQFSFAFTEGAAARAHVARLVQEFGAIAPLAVEVRHASWQTDAALAFLRGLGVSVVHLDHPVGRDGFTLAEPGVDAAGFTYFRLHGRSPAWFDKAAGRDQVYDWLYTRGEVASLHGRVAAMAAAAGETFVIANNHFEGKAMKVALELSAAQTGASVDVPELLLATYPDLASIAWRRGQGSLFC